MSTSSRFKLLDPFEKEDKDIFFGRDEEVKQLYKLVHQSNLTLVYGLSGTGKTSLIECGLANYFTPSEWHEIYIRRHDDINKSLKETLQQQLSTVPTHKSLEEQFLARRGRRQENKGAEVAQAPRPEGVVKWLSDIYSGHFKPVYLIFDQFEELFILGEPEERRQFYGTVENILDELPFCKLIFVMREESLGKLIEMERRLPSLQDNKMRVEPISYTRLTQKFNPDNPTASGVIAGMCHAFNIQLEGEQIPGEIIKALTKDDEENIELTYLQVFLHRLDEKATDNRFTRQLIKEEGNIDDVLADFLQVRIQEEQKKLSLPSKEGDIAEARQQVPDDVVKWLLEPFATLHGTKQPLKRSKIAVAGLDEKQVNEVLASLVDSRILSKHKDEYELTHDALARAINDQRSADEVTMIKIVRIVRDRYETFGNPTKTYLTAHEVDLVNSYREQLKQENKLQPEEWKFIEKSNRRVIINRFKQLFLVPGIALVLFALLLSGGLGYLMRGGPDNNTTERSQLPKGVPVPTDPTALDLAIEFWNHFSSGENSMDEESFDDAAGHFSQALGVIDRLGSAPPEVAEQVRRSIESIEIREGGTAQAFFDNSQEYDRNKEPFYENLRKGDQLMQNRDPGTDILIEALEAYRNAYMLNYPYQQNLLRNHINSANKAIDKQIGKLQLLPENPKWQADIKKLEDARWDPE